MPLSFCYITTCACYAASMSIVVSVNALFSCLANVSVPNTLFGSEPLRGKTRNLSGNDKLYLDKRRMDGGRLSHSSILISWTYSFVLTPDTIPTRQLLLFMFNWVRVMKKPLITNIVSCEYPKVLRGWSQFKMRMMAPVSNKQIKIKITIERYNCSLLCGCYHTYTANLELQRFWPPHLMSPLTYLDLSLHNRVQFEHYPF